MSEKKVVGGLWLDQEKIDEIEESSDSVQKFIREAVDEKLGSGNPESQTEEPVPDIENPTAEEVLDLLGLDYRIEGPLGLPIPRARLKLVKRSGGDEE